MLRSVIFLAGMLFASGAYCQSITKYPVGNSGCSAGFPCNPGAFEYSKSPDGAEVYTGECHNDDISYEVICVKLKTPIGSTDASETVLINYLDYIKTTLSITSAKGYAKGLRLKNRSDICGVVDFWKSKGNENLIVKGWTNGKYICVLYVNTKKNVQESAVDAFLTSASFPGM